MIVFSDRSGAVMVAHPYTGELALFCYVILPDAPSQNYWNLPPTPDYVILFLDRDQDTYLIRDEPRMAFTLNLDFLRPAGQDPILIVWTQAVHNWNVLAWYQMQLLGADHGLLLQVPMPSGAL